MDEVGVEDRRLVDGADVRDEVVQFPEGHRDLPSSEVGPEAEVRPTRPEAHLRVGVPAHSPSGFREALHNALVHRDYTRSGAVHVQIRESGVAGAIDGEIEVSNPGGFPEQVRLDNILVAPPRPRNPPYPPPANPR